MELKEKIMNLKSLTDSEKEFWADRSDELKAEGLDDEDITHQIITEMKEDADKDLAQLKTGISNKQ